MPSRCRASLPLPSSAFVGFRFWPDVIPLAVRWYLRFGLSYRDIEELLAERGVEVDLVSVYRWVKRLTRRHAFVQNVRRGHYELAANVPAKRRLAQAITELALAI